MLKGPVAIPINPDPLLRRHGTRAAQRVDIFIGIDAHAFQRPLELLHDLPANP